MGLKESTLHWPPFVIEVQQRQSEDKHQKHGGYKKAKLNEELNTENIWKLTESGETAWLRSLRLSTTTVKTYKISMLVYTNSGNAILALASNGPIYNRGGHELTMARVVR
ncbi:hypothetical protein ABKV19_026821 [Rosa sericea]